MKKIAMFIAAAAIAVSASAQKTVITGNKAGDNWFVGVNAGAGTSATFTGDSFKAFDPTFGVRVGKNLNTVLGVAADIQASFDAHKSSCDYSNSTFVQGMSADLIGLVNFSNLFFKYNGTPRFFEVYGVLGLGWGHKFGSPNEGIDALRAKGAIDFAVNLGSDKQWQVYVEPGITYFNSLQGIDKGDYKFNINNAFVTLKAGVNYKFGTSNGTHNFAIEQLRDQAEIDALNAKINAARAEADAAKAAAAAKDAQIAQLKKALADCENKPAPVVETKAANLQPSVVFGQGKSVVEKSQMANVQLIANYMKKNPDAKVKISGYASPEGNAELNQKLSEARAEAVKNVLVKNYKISADRLETEGLGATDKLFEEVEFNRVALFNDTTK